MFHKGRCVGWRTESLTDPLDDPDMDFRYTVESTPQGWSVSEGDQIVLIRNARCEALELGRLLALATKASGGSATLTAHRDDGLVEVVRL